MNTILEKYSYYSWKSYILNSIVTSLGSDIIWNCSVNIHVCVCVALTLERSLVMLDLDLD